LGCQKAIQLVPEAEKSLCRLDDAGFDMLSPLGTLLVNQHDLDDEYDCSELENGYGLARDPNSFCGNVETLPVMPLKWALPQTQVMTLLMETLKIPLPKNILEVEPSPQRFQSRGVRLQSPRRCACG
jgi:hypothetical protein